ncbi:MAG: LysR substrate-binding domain-containing protein [Pseudomonadota bacterium]
MNWRGVPEAVAVAETGSFTAAADILNTTVANISRRVSDLEDRLGSKLFIRTTRNVTVNPDSELYIERCREALDLLDEAENELSAKLTQLSGPIRVTAAIEFGERVIVPFVMRFQTQHPDVLIELDLSNDRHDLIEGRFDLAVRMGESPDSSLLASKLGQRQLQTAASPSYLEKRGEPQRLSELRHHNCLRGASRQWRFSQNGKTVMHRVQGRSSCNSGPAITSMALSGLGIAQLPDYYLVSHFQDKTLIRILNDYEPDPEGIWIVRPDNRFVPRRVRMFVDELLLAAADQPLQTPR